MRLQVGMVFTDKSDPDKEIDLEIRWNFKDKKQKTVRKLNGDNGHHTMVPFKLSLMQTCKTFVVSAKDATGAMVCQSLKGSFQDLLVAKGQLLTKKVTGGLIKVQLSPSENSYPEFVMQLAATNLPVISGFFSSCDPFMRILKRNSQQGTYYLVYESEIHKSTSNPSFRAFKMSA